MSANAPTTTARLYAVTTQEMPGIVVWSSTKSSGRARTTIDESANATAIETASAISRARRGFSLAASESMRAAYVLTRIAPGAAMLSGSPSTSGGKGPHRGLAVEFFGAPPIGALWAVKGGAKTELAPGTLQAPGGVAVRQNGTLFVTTGTFFGPDAGGVVRINPWTTPRDRGGPAAGSLLSRALRRRGGRPRRTDRPRRRP
jgi:hypothetical protein